MTTISEASREALEQFAERVIAEHRAGDEARCERCRRSSPCSVEAAAIATGLLAPPPLFLVDDEPRWHVRADEADVTCWDYVSRDYGSIITFHRYCVENPHALERLELDARQYSALLAARQHLATLKAGDDDGSR